MFVFSFVLRVDTASQLVAQTGLKFNSETQASLKFIAILLPLFPLVLGLYHYVQLHKFFIKWGQLRAL